MLPEALQDNEGRSNKYFTPGVVTAILTVAALAATALGKTGLATFLGSPEAATAVQGAIASVGALIAGVLGGVSDKPQA